jgi:hypothetical protein
LWILLRSCAFYQLIMHYGSGAAWVWDLKWFFPDPDPAKSFALEQIEIRIHTACERSENLVLFVFLHFYNFYTPILLYSRENCALQMERVRENYNSQVRSVKVKINLDQNSLHLCLLDGFSEKMDTYQPEKRQISLFLLCVTLLF